MKKILLRKVRNLNYWEDHKGRKWEIATQGNCSQLFCDGAYKGKTSTKSVRRAADHIKEILRKEYYQPLRLVG
jgi:hypothetical protein